MRLKVSFENAQKTQHPRKTDYPLFAHIQLLWQVSARPPQRAEPLIRTRNESTMLHPHNNERRTYSSETVEATLNREAVHRDWAVAHNGSAGILLDRTLRQRAIDHMNLGRGARMLDAGCGPELRHSIEFARLGFRVDAIDVSEVAVEASRRFAASHAPELPIQVATGSLLELAAPDATYDFVLCAHVLMHVPEIQRAIEQLLRVLKPGGWLLVLENNAHSVQELVRNRLKIQYANPTFEPEGHVYLTQTSSGESYIARHLDVRWFLQFCEQRGARLEKRWSREFTELYTVIKNPLLASAVHKLNTALFWMPGVAPLALQNALLLRKTLAG